MDRNSVVACFFFGFVLPTYMGESHALTGPHRCPTNDKNVYKCCYNYYAVGGRCEACPDGSYGHGCNSNCSDGFFGLFCKEICECDSSECDKQLGCASAATKSTTLEAEETSGFTKLSKPQSTSNELTSMLFPSRQDQSTSKIKEKYTENVFKENETNEHISLTEIVAVASSTAVVILLVVMFVLLLRRNLRKIKKRDKDGKPDGRLTSVVMSQIYDEINDNCSERSAGDKSKFESKSSDDSGKSRVEIGVSDVFEKQLSSKQSRGSYLPLLESTKQAESVGHYDMLDRASTSRCLSKVADCNEECGGFRIEKSGKRDENKDRHESTNIYSVPPRQVNKIHLQDEKIGGDEEMPIYKIPRSSLLRMSEIPSLPLKK